MPTIETLQMALAEVGDIASLHDHPITRLKEIEAIVIQMRRDDYYEAGLCPDCGLPGLQQ